MEVFGGRSLEVDASRAVLEATSGWDEPEMILVFTSPVRPAADVASALVTRFPRAKVVGCTTAGEHLGGEHTKGGLVATGIRSSKLRWATAMVEDLATADTSRIRATVDGMFAELGIERETFDARKYFCLFFIDGLSGREEVITPLVSEALDGIVLVGGSAGDDLRFERTDVICGATAATGSAVLALCECGVDFSVLKHQHFVCTGQLLAITRADVAARRVFEIDGVPAARAYARALGIPREAFDATVAFEHPLVFQYEHQLYVRSLRQIHDDDSLSFYCAIEEGMVVSVGDREPMVAALASNLTTVQADLVIGSNCILRALEADKLGLHDELGQVFRTRAKHMIGFDTYGEQLDGLHVNQTFVALALSDKKEAA
jgi:hypothetical protein